MLFDVWLLSFSITFLRFTSVIVGVSRLAIFITVDYFLK